MTSASYDLTLEQDFCPPARGSDPASVDQFDDVWRVRLGDWDKSSIFMFRQPRGTGDLLHQHSALHTLKF